MALLVVKLIATPLVILAATLAARRWGEAVGGWLTGLPLTSGPLSVFLAIEQGPRFAAEAAAGSLSGVVSQAAFCVGYASLARLGWPAGFLGGAIAYVGVASGLNVAPLPHLALFVCACGALTLVLLVLPRRGALRAAVAPPRWDLPARLVVTTALVVGVSSAATALGPRASGVVASFPILAASLTVFAQIEQGPQAGIAVLRGMAGALYGFAIFFLVAGATLARLDLAPAFALAAAGALVAQGASLRLVRAPLAAVAD